MNITELKKIRSEDLIFSGDIEDDRTNTYLQLDDYDWMDYKLITKFKTKDLGTLDVIFNYFGAIFSYMKVKYENNGISGEITYKYNSDIFIKHIKKFLKKHIAQWDSIYAFNGEDVVLDFYNEVIETGVVKSTK